MTKKDIENRVRQIRNRGIPLYVYYGKDGVCSPKKVAACLLPSSNEYSPLPRRIWISECMTIPEMYRWLTAYMKGIDQGYKLCTIGKPKLKAYKR